MTIDPTEALEKARSLIEKGDGVNGTLRISGVAAALSRDHGVSRDEEVRAGFFELLDARMDKTGPGGMVGLLEQCQRAGYRMGIVTFVRRERISRRLRVWSLGSYFGSVVTPDDVAEVKPSPVPFLKAMSDLDVRPVDCIVVGDEPVDMIGGKRAGAGTVGLPVGFFSSEELLAAGADHILSSVNLLPTLLGI